MRFLSNLQLCLQVLLLAAQFGWAGLAFAATSQLKGQNHLLPDVEHYRLLVKFNADYVQDISEQQLMFVRQPPAGAQAAIKSAKSFIPQFTYQQVVQFTPQEKQVLQFGQVPPAAPGKFDYFAYRGMAYVAEAETMTAAEALQLAESFEQLAIVEYAALEPLLPIAPPSATPLLSDYQDYRFAQHPTASNVVGINAEYAWKQGITGEGVQVADIEWGFNYQHEDLQSDRFIELLATTNHSYDDHGTAVAGIMIAQENSYGMKGMVHGVDKFFGVSEIRYGRVAGIVEGLKKLAAGDVFLYEMQTGGQGNNYVPADYNQAVWDITKSATDAGVIVVAAAGNGNENLDGAFYTNYRARGDNGSIIVGAGTRVGQHRTTFSTYGSPVHVQGWGDWSVATTGYGNLYNGGENATYNDDFSGTSSATPLVASAVVAIQSWVKREFQRSLSPREMRALLINTGTAQGNGEHIGPLPNIQTAIEQLMQTRYVDNADGTVFDSKTGLIWLRCSLGQTWQQGRCVGNVDLLSYEQAVRQADAFVDASQHDWRLPTVNELKTLVVCSSGVPATWKDSNQPCFGNFQRPTVDTTTFPDQVATAVWSVSPYLGATTQVWAVHFDNGEARQSATNGTAHSARLVRGGSLATLAAPTMLPATTVTANSLKVHWQPVAGAMGYRIRLARDRAFTDLVAGYQNLDVANVTSLQLSSLNPSTNYYFQVQTYDATAMSVFSAPLAVTTATSQQFQVAVITNAGGVVTPVQQQVSHGVAARITIMPHQGYQIYTVSGCGGTLQDNIYTTTPVTSACQVTVRFSKIFDVAARYQYLASGSIVRDLVTGLEWQRCSVGQSWSGSKCEGEATRFNWVEALNLPVPTGFRLPTVNEIAGLVYCSNIADTKPVTSHEACGESGSFQQPTIYLPAFPDAPTSRYWSATAIIPVDGRAWYVSHVDGHVAATQQLDSLNVRFVRNSTLARKRNSHRRLLYLATKQPK